MGWRSGRVRVAAIRSHCVTFHWQWLRSRTENNFIRVCKENNKRMFTQNVPLDRQATGSSSSRRHIADFISVIVEELYNLEYISRGNTENILTALEIGSSGPCCGSNVAFSLRVWNILRLGRRRAVDVHVLHLSLSCSQPMSGHSRDRSRQRQLSG